MAAPAKTRRADVPAAGRHSVHHRPAPSAGGWLGLGLAALAAGLGAALVMATLGQGPSPRGALLGLVTLADLGLMGFLFWWTWAYFTLRYSLEPEALVIRWGSLRFHLPYGSLGSPRRGVNSAAAAATRGGLRWPGYYIGSAGDGDAAAGIPDTYCLATRPPEGQLLLPIAGAAFGISPADPDRFLQDLEARRRLAEGLPDDGPRVQRTGLAGLELWTDGLALRALVVGLMLNLLAFLWIAWQYPQLESMIALRLHYDPVWGLTLPGAAQPSSTIWRLPLLGLALLGFNALLAALLHRRVRLGANLLLIGAAIVQVGLVLILTRLG